MKVWLTGARGMLGHALRERLERHGVSHVTSDHALDIADTSAVQAFAERERPTLIVNAAAYTRVDDAEREREAAQRTNAQGPAALAEAARAVDARLLHFSTDYVFAGNASRPYLESDVTGPLGAYGATKLEGEQALLAATGEARTIVVRTSWLFGENGKNFVSTILNLAKERKELKIVADQRGRPTYTGDLADAALALVGIGRKPAAQASGVYHFANAGETTWFDFTSEIVSQARALGLPLQVERVLPISTAEFPRPAPRPAYSVLSTNRIEAALGYSPAPWQHALASYLRSFT